MCIDNKQVSIIMPSYNTGRFIGESIKSVIKQTYKNWELIIVDDNSMDDTEKIVSNFSDSRIRFYKNYINQGAAFSRNFAIKKAQGKWIAFLDSDDIWEENKLEEQLNFMINNGYYFSYTSYEEFNEITKEKKIVTGPQKITKIGMLCYCWPGCLTVMYDAEHIGAVEVENLKKNNDYAMWLKIIKKADCYLLNKKLAKYRKREGSISSSSFSNLVKYHYYLFRFGEEKGKLISGILTLNNLFFGCVKKIIYVHK